MKTKRTMTQISRNKLSWLTSYSYASSKFIQGKNLEYKKIKSPEKSSEIKINGVGIILGDTNKYR